MATSAELTLTFSSNSQVNVSFDGADSGQLDFSNPITDQDRTDIRWYVETYGARSLADPDDKEAQRIQARLPEIGTGLFESVFGNSAALEPFLDFRKANSKQRVITISSDDASILSLPWELLHDPRGVFLFREKPHISVRRKITGAVKGRQPFQIKKKENLHLLFVVSRPTDAGFIDPRADPQAVLDALEEHAPGRVTCEFLRPATLNALVKRLDDETKPAIDILHFDGHGEFRQVSEEEANKYPALYGRSIISVLLRERQSRGAAAAGKPVGVGFLVFEKEDRTMHLISADDLGENLFRSQVGLVVLSACQTASLEHDGDPMASVAGSLTRTGIPAILAMTHSVLVATTRMLFGEFYGSLAKGRGIATALDDARTYLANNPQKYEVQRGQRRQMLELQDWFVPALFHGGSDSPLLSVAFRSAKDAQAPDASFAERKATMAERKATKHNLRARHEAGFFGRRRELWDIAYWFGTGQSQRISITGFGGQGKTELAMEAGRWLLRTEMFSQAVCVDYAGVQSHDALASAVSTISAVLEETLATTDEVTEALARTPTLVILDNLETVAPEALQELLTAASKWSTAGGSRVLLTSRNPETGHADYAIEGTFKHRRIVLEGLGSAANPDDALEWFAKLSLLPSAEPPQVPPPRRDDLIRLFDRVRFHPLSICVLVQQLKTRTADELDERLEQLLAEDAVSPVADEGTPRSLIASLQLSLERLSEEERHAARRLGVFQGGAFESSLLAITELGESDSNREQMQALLSPLESGDPRVLLRMMGVDLPDDAEIPAELLDQLTNDPQLQQHIEELRAQLSRPEPGRVELPEQREGEQDADRQEAATAVPAETAFARSGLQPQENLWPGLRRSLEAAALIEAENIPGVGPPFLRFHPTLAPMLWASLDAAVRDALTLAHRQRYYALAGYLYQEDRTNPHQARAIARRELPNLLHAVHQALDAGDADAVDFVDSINQFLNFFGMTREAARLTRRAEQAGGERGSRAWFLAQSGRGEQLLDAGQIQAAADIFTDILQSLGNTHSYDLAVTLGRLGRCYGFGGRPDLAEETYRQGITVTEKLDPSDQAKRHRGALHTDLADVLAAQGKFAEAREQYAQGLEIITEVKDLRSHGAILGQLGMLAMLEGDLADAVQRYYEALELFQRLGEPASEAIIQHQLGVAFQRAKQWEQAEQHYRESARLEQQRGNLAAAALTWNNLAMVSKSAGKLEAAETWYRKAIEVDRDNPKELAPDLNNLANLLQNQPGRLAEARQLAEESLAIKKILDPGAAEIWKNYGLLAQIADQQSQPERAAEYRRLAREAKRNFAGTAHEMKRFAPVIASVLGAVAGNEEAQAGVNQLVEQFKQGGGESANLAQGIERILAGERDAESLCKDAGLTASMIIETILQALEDPSILEALLPPSAPSE